MWGEMNEPWRICFEEAWEAYCNGSIPIGAVIVTNKLEIISRGRNMIGERIEELRRLSRSKIAHAEMNAIYSSEQEIKNMAIYSTMFLEAMRLDQICNQQGKGKPKKVERLVFRQPLHLLIPMISIKYKTSWLILSRMHPRRKIFFHYWFVLQRQSQDSI